MLIKLQVRAPSLSNLRNLLVDAAVDIGCAPIAERSGADYAVTAICDQQEHQRLANQLPQGVSIDVLETLPVPGGPPVTVGRGNRFDRTRLPRGLGNDGLPVTYLNYDEFVAGLRVLADAYTPHCDLVVLPHSSVKNRPIYALRVGTQRGRHVPTVIFVGGIHAREWVPPDALFYLCADLLEAHTSRSGLTYGRARFSPEEIQAIFSRIQLVVLPCANPDGRVYSQRDESASRWRKNRARYDDHRGRRCIGVDLNRNFNVAWEFKRIFSHGAEVSASDTPCHPEVFVGPRAESEPETRNVVWLFDQYPHTRRYLDVHSHLPAILHPWSIDQLQTNDSAMTFRNKQYDGVRGDLDGTYYQEFIEAEDLVEFQRLGQLMKVEIEKVRGDVYEVGSSLDFDQLYPCPGTSKDYAYNRHFIDPDKSKIFAFTVECGRERQPRWPEAAEVCREVAAGAIRLSVDAALGVGSVGST